MVPIQLPHERRQVLRNHRASGVGEFGPQSACKRLQELHWVEGDCGQTAHSNAPTDLPWPQPFGRAPYVVNTTEVVLFPDGSEIFAGDGTEPAVPGADALEVGPDSLAWPKVAKRGAGQLAIRASSHELFA
jgi:hypothetical protein